MAELLDEQDVQQLITLKPHNYLVIYGNRKAFEQPQIPQSMKTSKVSSLQSFETPLFVKCTSNSNIQRPIIPQDFENIYSTTNTSGSVDNVLFGTEKISVLEAQNALVMDNLFTGDEKIDFLEFLESIIQQQPFKSTLKNLKFALTVKRMCKQQISTKKTKIYSSNRTTIDFIPTPALSKIFNCKSFKEKEPVDEEVITDYNYDTPRPEDDIFSNLFYSELKEPTSNVLLINTSSPINNKMRNPKATFKKKKKKKLE